MKILKKGREIYWCIVLILLCLSSYGQFKYDSLSKYTYLLIQYAKDPAKSGSASCFFIRKDKKIYLFTCYHVFTGLDSWSGTNKGPYDSIQVRYYDNKNRAYFFTIKPPSEGFNFKNFIEEPDVYFYDVTELIPKNVLKNLNSIEKFIDAEKQKKNYNSLQLISYQYTRSNNDIIAKQTESIKRNNEFSWTYPNAWDQPNILTSDYKISIPFHEQQLNSSLLYLPNENSKLDSENTLSIQNYFPSWRSNKILADNQSNENALTIINNSISIASPFITVDTLFENYFNNKDYSFSFEKPEPLKIISVNGDINELTVNYNKSFETLLSAFLSPVDQDTLRILPNSEEVFYINKNDYFFDFDSVRRKHSSWLGLYIPEDLKENTTNFDTPGDNDRFLNINEQSKNELVLSIPNTLQSTILLSPQNNLSDFKQVNILPFSPVSKRDIFAQIDFTLFSPSFYTASSIDGTAIGINDTQFYDNYFTATQPLALGGSGSPFFYVCKRTNNGSQVEWIEFGGMQCGLINESAEYLFFKITQPIATIILRADVIIRDLNLLK